MKRPLVCLLATLALNSPASGQSAAFEVVSIKPAPENKKELQQHLGTQIDPAMVHFGGVSLLMLITRAYGLHSFQVLGAPELNTTRFNIVAKLPSGSSTAQVPEMLETLLRERFHLVAHRETREFGVYALTAPKGGSKVPLKPSGDDPAPGRGLPPGTMARAADFINQYDYVLRFSRPVVDQTGLEADHIDLASFVHLERIWADHFNTGLRGVYREENVFATRHALPARPANLDQKPCLLRVNSSMVPVIFR
jgi:uncharacterized protein (TIGR03435 family)